MATIIEFRTSQSRSSSTAHTMSGIPGEVVMFPGVRYEQMDAASPQTAKKRSTRRDVLELED